MKPTVLALLASSLLPLHAEIAVKEIATGFERPLWAGVPKGVTGKLWVMEQAGRVWIVDLATGQKSEKPFLDASTVVSRKDNEEGLLGLAFAPDFDKTGRFYVNYTDKQKQTKIVRYTSADRVTTDPATAEDIMVYPSEYSNHNGGWVAFGPDNMLYIGNGDGGSQYDPNNHAQDPGSLLGKILRIDVSPAKGYQVPKGNPFMKTEGAKPEIFAIGLRNPWRCSFDKTTGDLWIGDVGQDRWEEIDFVAAGKLAGANFGWRLREGLVPTPKEGVGGEEPRRNVDPVYAYKHGAGPSEGVSVTGGYVYRGPIKELQGRYIFADYQNPRIWSFTLDEKRKTAIDFKDHTASLQPKDGRINLIPSFAEDNEGNLYILDHTGPVYQIIER